MIRCTVYKSVSLDLPDLLSLPAVLSWCVLHHFCHVLCLFDFFMFIVSASGYGSLCLCRRLNVTVLVQCVSALLWRFPASVSHVLSQPSSACVLFLVCCANTLPLLCCKHAELWETYVLSGIIYVLNTNLLLQPTQDSILGLLQILQLLVVVRIKHRFGLHISININIKWASMIECAVNLIWIRGCSNDSIVHLVW